MLTFRPDTSFPFLAIARRFDMPYALVLNLAGHIERGAVTTSGDMMMARIADAVASERERRKLVTASV